MEFIVFVRRMGAVSFSYCLLRMGIIFPFVTCPSFILKMPHCAINVTDRISVIERGIYQGTFDKPPLYAAM